MKISQTTTTPCTHELIQLGNIARAQRALTDFIVRKELLISDSK